MSELVKFLHSFESTSIAKMSCEDAVVSLLEANPSGMTLGVVLNRMRTRRSEAKRAIEKLLSDGKILASFVNETGRGRSSMKRVIAHS